MLKKFKDIRRRLSQSVRETTYLASRVDDSDFNEAYSMWKAVNNASRHFQDTARGQAEATKRYYQTMTAAAVELVAFHRTTPNEQGACVLGQALADLERVQLAAFDRLFEEEVITAVDMLLWNAPAIEQRVKQRKGLLLDYNAYVRKYNASASALERYQKGSRSGGFFSKAKSEIELETELATRKLKLEHAQEALKEATEWCLEQFQALLDQRDSGNILGSAMVAFYACQRMLMEAGTKRLEMVRQFMGKKVLEDHEKQLALFIADFAQLNAANGNELFGDNDFAEAALTNAPEIFGVPLTSKCPIVIQEAIEFLEANGGLETPDLFKISGDPDVVADLRDRYITGETNFLEEMECDVHDVATLIKVFLKELPESLIPSTFYYQFVEAAKEHDDCESLANLMGELPVAHINCLSPLLRFLYKAARRADINRMTFTALATHLATFIIRAPENESRRMMDDMSDIITGLKTLIEHAKRFDLSNMSVITTPLRASENRPPLPPTSQNRTPNHRYSSMKPHSAIKAPNSAHSAIKAPTGSGFSFRRMSMRRSTSSTALNSQMF